MRTEANEAEIRVECEELGDWMAMHECQHRTWPFNDCPHSVFCTDEIEKVPHDKVRYIAEQKAFKKMVFEDYWM